MPGWGTCVPPASRRRMPAAARARGVDLDLDPAVARMAPRHEVGAPEELAVRDHDRSWPRPSKQAPAVDLAPTRATGDAGAPRRSGGVPSTTMFTASSWWRGPRRARRRRRVMASRRSSVAPRRTTADADGAPEVARARRVELDQRSRVLADGVGDVRVGAAHQHVGGSRRGLSPRRATPHHTVATPAAMTPRWHAAAASRALRRVRSRRRDLADLAEEVDALLHVADEVAARDLVVVEDVGEVVTAAHS